MSPNNMVANLIENLKKFIPKELDPYDDLMPGTVWEGDETLLGARLICPIDTKVSYEERKVTNEKVGVGHLNEKMVRKKMEERKKAIKKRKLEGGEGTKVMIDRWPAERYEAAQRKLVDVIRELGASPGRPMARMVVRDEAKKQIRDTGLLDHLLGHIVGKIVANGSERIQRRHNAEGGMEYWLESTQSQSFLLPEDATMEKKACELREEAVTVERDSRSLLQFKLKMEEEISNMWSCLKEMKLYGFNSLVLDNAEGTQLMKEEKSKKPNFPIPSNSLADYLGGGILSKLAEMEEQVGRRYD